MESGVPIESSLSDKKIQTIVHEDHCSDIHRETNKMPCYHVWWIIAVLNMNIIFATFWIKLICTKCQSQTFSLPSLMLQLHVTKRTMNEIMQKMWTLYYNQWSQHSSLVQTFDASKKLWEVILWDFLPLLYQGWWVTPLMVPSSLSTLNSIYIIMYYIAYKKRWKYTYHTIPYQIRQF